MTMKVFMTWVVKKAIFLENANNAFGKETLPCYLLFDFRNDKYVDNISELLKTSKNNFYFLLCNYQTNQSDLVLFRKMYVRYLLFGTNSLSC